MTWDDLCNHQSFALKHCVLPAFQLTLACSQERNGINAVIGLDVETIYWIYNIDGTDAIVPPPKRFDQMANSLAIQQIKQAVFSLANNQH